MTDAVIAADSLLVVEQQQTSVVQVESSGNTIVERENTALVVEERQSVQALIQQAPPIVAVVAAGTQGPPGISEDSMAYSIRVDFVGDTVIYRAEAEPGTADSAAGWRIRKITIAGDGDVTTQWAGGSAAFDKVWNDRLTLEYA